MGIEARSGLESIGKVGKELKKVRDDREKFCTSSCRKKTLFFVGTT